MPARRRNRIRRLYERVTTNREMFIGSKLRLATLMRQQEERRTEAERAALEAERAAFAAMPSEAQQRVLDGLTAILRARYSPRQAI